MRDETAPIDFDTESGSWERACTQSTLIERVAWDRWLVTLADGEDVHLVQLHRDHGAYLGACHVADEDGDRDEACLGWTYHDGPCAHLCAVRRAAYGQQPGESGEPLTDTHGQPVRIFDSEAVANARVDHAVEKARTDGGVRR